MAHVGFFSFNLASEQICSLNLARQLEMLPTPDLYPPQTWISCMDDIMTSQSIERWILLRCTFVSILIFVFSMNLILFNYCSRRKMKKRTKINERRNIPSRCLPQNPPISARSSV